jgi:hypothetical protein
MKQGAEVLHKNQHSVRSEPRHLRFDLPHGLEAGAASGMTSKPGPALCAAAGSACPETE